MYWLTDKTVHMFSQHPLFAGGTVVSSVVSSISGSTSDVTTSTPGPHGQYDSYQHDTYQPYDPAHAYDPYANNFPNIKNINNAKIPGIEAVNVPFHPKTIDVIDDQKTRSQDSAEGGPAEDPSPDAGGSKLLEESGVNSLTNGQAASGSKHPGNRGGVGGERRYKLAQNDEKRLFDSLMWGYDRNVRPVLNSSHPVIIQLGITLTQIFDMVSELELKKRIEGET